MLAGRLKATLTNQSLKSIKIFDKKNKIVLIINNEILTHKNDTKNFLTQRKLRICVI